MVVELKLSRSGDRKFGFRLVGGADFEIPLTVSLVGEGSIAEESGMLAGDVVVQINHTPVTSLSHQEAHEVLSSAGSDIVVCVLREKDLTPVGPSPVPTVSSPVERAEEFSFEPAFVRDNSNFSDEQIAEIISGEAEVLRDHNIIGVDFNKLMPQNGVFKNSEVFQTLQHETRKTKEDIEAEQKRWTTFLQKPDRPIPKKLDMKAKNTYKPQIVKQPRPSIAPDANEPMRSQSPMAQFPVHLPLARSTATPEPHYPESREPSRATTPVPEIMIEEVEPEKQPEPEPTPKIEEANVQEDPTEFAKQLAGVQQQLLALQSLPNTIQATLDAITSQLTFLLNPPKVEEKKVEVVEPLVEEPEPEPLPMPGPEPPMNHEDEEETYDIPEPEDAIHVGPHTEEEVQECQMELEKHEEDWQAKQEKKTPQSARNDEGTWLIKTARFDIVNTEIYETITIYRVFN